MESDEEDTPPINGRYVSVTKRIFMREVSIPSSFR
jgi:hypothetical protein